jgi:altronate hydrolase
MDMLAQVIGLHEDDNVATARNTLHASAVLNELNGLVVRAEVPAAHKIALRDIEAGALVRRYGQTIGRAPVRINDANTSISIMYR